MHLKEVNYTFLDSAKTLNIGFSFCGERRSFKLYVMLISTDLLTLMPIWGTLTELQNNNQPRIKNKSGFSREAYT